MKCNMNNFYAIRKSIHKQNKNKAINSLKFKYFYTFLLDVLFFCTCLTFIKIVQKIKYNYEFKSIILRAHMCSFCPRYFLLCLIYFLTNFNEISIVNIKKNGLQTPSSGYIQSLATQH